MRLSSTIAFTVLAASATARQTCFVGDTCSQVLAEHFSCDISDDNTCPDYARMVHDQLYAKAGDRTDEDAAAKRALAAHIREVVFASQNAFVESQPTST